MWRGEGLKPKDLAYQSGTDGKLQVSIKRQQSFVLNFLGGRRRKTWRQKARKKTSKQLENCVVFAFGCKKLLIIFAGWPKQCKKQELSGKIYCCQRHLSIIFLFLCVAARKLEQNLTQLGRTAALNVNGHILVDCSCLFGLSWSAMWLKCLANCANL